MAIKNYCDEKGFYLIQKSYLTILAVEEQEGATSFVTAGGRQYNLYNTPILKKNYKGPKKYR